LGAFRIERVGRLTDRQPADRHSPDRGLENDGVAVGVTTRAVSLAAPVKLKTVNPTARTVTRGCGDDRVLRASLTTTWISFQTMQHCDARRFFCVGCRPVALALRLAGFVERPQIAMV